MLRIQNAAHCEIFKIDSSPFFMQPLQKISLYHPKKMRHSVPKVRWTTTLGWQALHCRPLVHFQSALFSNQRSDTSRNRAVWANVHVGREHGNCTTHMVGEMGPVAIHNLLPMQARRQGRGVMPRCFTFPSGRRTCTPSPHNSGPRLDCFIGRRSCLKTISALY